MEYNDKQGTNYRVLSKDMYVIVDEAVSILGMKQEKQFVLLLNLRKSMVLLKREELMSNMCCRYI